MEPYVDILVEMRRQELIAGVRQGRAAATARRAGKTPDALRGLPRVRMMWWIAAARLRRPATETAGGAR